MAVQLAGKDVRGPLNDLPDDCFALHMGIHALSGVERPTELVAILPTALYCRMVLRQEPLRTDGWCIPGALASPLPVAIQSDEEEQLAVPHLAVVQVSSLDVLFAWDAKEARAAVELARECAFAILRRSGGANICEDGWDAALLSRTRNAAAAAARAMPSRHDVNTVTPGRLAVVFRSATLAATFALGLRHDLAALDWSLELLRHELCEPVGDWTIGAASPSSPSHPLIVHLERLEQQRQATGGPLVISPSVGGADVLATAASAAVAPTATGTSPATLDQPAADQGNMVSAHGERTGNSGARTPTVRTADAVAQGRGVLATGTRRSSGLLGAFSDNNNNTSSLTYRVRGGDDGDDDDNDATVNSIDHATTLDSAVGVPSPGSRMLASLASKLSVGRPGGRAQSNVALTSTGSGSLADGSDGCGSSEPASSLVTPPSTAATQPPRVAGLMSSGKRFLSVGGGVKPAAAAAEGKQTPQVTTLDAPLLRGLRSRTVVVPMTADSVKWKLASRGSGRVVYTGPAVRRGLELLKRARVGQVVVVGGRARPDGSTAGGGGRSLLATARSGPIAAPQQDIGLLRSLVETSTSLNDCT